MFRNVAGVRADGSDDGRLIGKPIAARQTLDLDEQSLGPHMRILGQPLPDIRLDPIKRINFALASATDT